MEKTLENKVVIITGSSSGIGEGTAVEFAKCGSRLTLTGRNVERLQATVNNCIAAGLSADKIHTVTGDLREREFLEKLIQSTVNKFGTIDVLVNNAGSGVFGQVLEANIEDLDEVYNVNLRAIFMTVQLALPHLIKSKGSIINVSSVAGIKPQPRAICYSLMKAALDQLTESLALEFGPQGVRVNSINPGWVPTGIVLTMSEEQKKEFLAAKATLVPLGRNGTVQEMSQAILFLASDYSAFISGVKLPLDGARSITWNY